MGVDLNVIAPIFKLNDVFGRHIDLNNYQDNKILIGFFRHAGCPFCNLRVHTLTKVYEALEKKGLKMIFFFESKEEIILRSTFHKEVSPIPIIADPGKKWYNTYGLENSGYKSAVSHLTSFIPTALKAKLKGLPVHPFADSESINTIPAEFLVDKNLKVKKLHYSKGLNDRMAVDTIREFAKNDN